MAARTKGAGAGVRRSRANPFKSTQLRQWGFICYLGGHIVSRRERTDRLRRASDGAGPREPAPLPTTPGSKGTTLSPRPLPPPFPPFAHPFHVFPLLFYDRRSPLVADVAAIRQKSGFAVTRPRRNFPRIARTPPPPPPPPHSLFRPFTSTGPSHFLSLPEILRWKNMAFCLHFCTLASEMRER